MSITECCTLVAIIVKGRQAADGWFHNRRLFFKQKSSSTDLGELLFFYFLVRSYATFKRLGCASRMSFFNSANISKTG